MCEVGGGRVGGGAAEHTSHRTIRRHAHTTLTWVCRHGNSGEGICRTHAVMYVKLSSQIDLHWSRTLVKNMILASKR